MSDATRAEVCAVAVAEAFRGDGEILASSFGTVPAVGARLAKLTARESEASLTALSAQRAFNNSSFVTTRSR